jgi:hypothetical protein
MTEDWKRLLSASALLFGLALMGLFVDEAASETADPDCSVYSGLLCIAPAGPDVTCENLGAPDCFDRTGAPPPPNCSIVQATCGMSEGCQDASLIPLYCEFGPGVHH